MPRVNYVKQARGRADGRPRICSGCGTEIKAGHPYKWFKIKLTYGGIRKNYCEDCRIRPSMMTNSQYRVTLLSGQEAAEDALAADGVTITDIAEAVRGYAEALRECGEMYQESASNIEAGFGHATYQSEELEEKAQECESLADEVESTADEIEALADSEGEDEDDEDGIGDLLAQAHSLAEEALVQEPM